MGVRNRERRKAKQRKRARGGAGQHGAPRDESRGSGDGYEARESVDEHDLFRAIARFLDQGMDREAAGAADLLAEGWGSDGGKPGAAAMSCFAHLGVLWDNGWQPADIAGAVGRHLKAVHLSLAGAAVRADSDRYRHDANADAAWFAQIDAMPGEEHGARAWLASWAETEGMAPASALLIAAALFGFLVRAPRLHPLSDPPSQWGRSSSRHHRLPEGLDPKVLARVRALLAKAESTTFPEEADALTAKAQQLIAAHAIDRALLDSAREAGAAGEAPGAVRVWIDNPYAGAKSMLLGEVAGATRCRAVWMPDLGCSTVFGMRADLDAVDLLFTSLLVQATHAMVASGKGQAPGRYRSRGFRQSFLTSFAIRIGQRLRKAAAEIVDDAASTNDALLPVLASQLERVAAAVDDAFPHLVNRRVSVADGAGWTAGVLAADRATLAPGGELSESE